VNHAHRINQTARFVKAGSFRSYTLVADRTPARRVIIQKAIATNVKQALEY